MFIQNIFYNMKSKTNKKFNQKKFNQKSSTKKSSTKSFFFNQKKSSRRIHVGFYYETFSLEKKKNF
jgi:hypothetical protein